MSNANAVAVDQRIAEIIVENDIANVDELIELQKVCSCCHQVKPKSQFSVCGVSRKTGLPYYASQCKPCRSLIQSIKYVKIPPEQQRRRGVPRGTKRRPRQTVPAQ